METTPFILILIVTLFITYIIVKFAVPKKCGADSDAYPRYSQSIEGFAVPDLKSCPYGTTKYVSHESQILCCDGKVDGKTCLGKDICRFTNSDDPVSPPLCADYVKSQMFNVKGSLIQNPDTDMCLVPMMINKENIVFGQKCSATDKNQLWTYNELGQLQHDSTGFCLTETVDPRTPFIKYHALGKCGLNDSQKYTYNFKANTIESKSSPGKSLFLQNLLGDDKRPVLLTPTSDDEIKSAFKRRDGKEIDKKSLDDLKKYFFSNSNNKNRHKFIGVKPTIAQSISIVQNKFKV
jgi:hypothetical protein